MKNKGKIIINIILFIISIIPFILGTFGIKTIISNGFFGGKGEIDTAFSIFGNMFLIGGIIIFVIALVLMICAIGILVYCIYNEKKEKSNINSLYIAMIVSEIVMYILIFIKTKI